MTPTPDPSPLIHYLYCLCRADSAPSPPPACPGVGGAVAAGLVEEGLMAVTGALPAETWTPAWIEARLADQEWVAREALAHEAVIEAWQETATVLPCKFMTIFSGSGALRDLLRREAARFLAVLERLDGHREWSVRLLADMKTLTAYCDTRPELTRLRAEQAEATGGRAYILGKKIGRERRILADRLMEDGARAVLRACEDLTPAGLRHEPAEGAGESRVILALTLLLPKEASPAGRLPAESLPPGLHCACSGPWPPYRFAGEGIPNA